MAFRLWPIRCLGGDKVKPCAKFGDNRTNGLGVIHVFANFNMAAGGHLGLRISTFWDDSFVLGEKWMIHAKLGAYRTNHFEVIQFFCKFQFFVVGHLGF